MIERLVQTLYENPIYLVLWVLVFVAMFFVKRRLNGLQAAERIIQSQFNSVPSGVVEQGFEQFKGEELKRYQTLVLRIRSKFGHDGFKVGHMAWIMQILQDHSVDVEAVAIPSFIKGTELGIDAKD